MHSPALDRMLRVTALYDLYGGLLTDRQREFLNLHYMRDLSLAEISEQYSVSRQSVHDTLTSAESALEKAEASLHLLELFEAARSAADSAGKRCEELSRLLQRQEKTCSAVAEAESLVQGFREDLDRISSLLRFEQLIHDE